MVEVKLSGPLKAAAGGRTSLSVEAANIHQLLSRLGQDHPKLKPLIDRGVAVSIDGQIYRDDWFRAIPPGSEVFILSDRDLAFDELRPTGPEFQLAGDAERVAITCAALGVDAADLELPVVKAEISAWLTELLGRRA